MTHASSPADREIKEIAIALLAQSMAQGSSFDPVGVFETGHQMQIALEACAFFLHAVDRLSFRESDERLRALVFDAIANQMVRTFSDMIDKVWAPMSIPDIERETADLFNTRQLEYAGAVRLIGEQFNDLTSASWLAAHNIANAAEIPDLDIRRLPIHTSLVRCLIAADIASRIKRVETIIG